MAEQTDAAVLYHRTFTDPFYHMQKGLGRDPPSAPPSSSAPKATARVSERNFRAYRLDRKRDLVDVLIVQRRDQRFIDYATPWEVTNSRLVLGHGGGTVDPVVDENMTVIGHRGTFRSDRIFVPEGQHNWGARLARASG